MNRIAVFMAYKKAFPFGKGFSSLWQPRYPQMIRSRAGSFASPAFARFAFLNGVRRSLIVKLSCKSTIFSKELTNFAAPIQ